MSPKEVLEFANQNDARQLDLRFTDLPGLQQHISYPIGMLKEEAFEEGFGIDGSSIRGWAAINESDMLLIPDTSTAFMDPFNEVHDAGNDVRRNRSDYSATLRQGPSVDREKSGTVPPEQRHRRHGVLRGRSGVLYLRQRAVRSEPALRLLLHRCGGGPLELRPGEGQSRLSASIQGRLLPGTANRPLSGPARRNGRGHD